MGQGLANSQIVFTNKAHCRDCYRCLRVCPVKAIRMHDGQAQVVPELCIACGTCIRECPQKAKTFRNDVDRAEALLAGPDPVAVSVAPSFVALFNDWQRKRLPSALRELGFAYVGETAIGAYSVARKTAQYVLEHPDHPHLCTACPAVVSFVERYHGDLAELLVPVVSPMLAHARHIRGRMGGGAKVVFIGPCIAKKAEAERPEHAGLVDCVLTFQELGEWFARRGINMAACEESAFDELPVGASRLFPLEGGASRTADMHTDMLSAEVLAVSGVAELVEALDAARVTTRPVVVEPLFCPEGCINGPAMPDDRNVFQRRTDVLRYAAGPVVAGQTPVELDLGACFRPGRAPDPIAEDAIRGVLEMTGKTTTAEELNCGACGYPTCRDKAIAVVRGMAEPEMCIPYMRRLAEQRTDRIIETSPNGILIVDDRLNILSMNPAFRKYFMCTEAVCGKHVSYLMDPVLFEKLATGEEKVIERVVRHDKYNLVCHQIVYTLPEDGQYVGIFVNITRSQADKEKLSQLRAETMLQARELLEHQIGMAQKIVQFLGESTAKGEQLVDHLMTLASEESTAPAPRADTRRSSRGWPWDTYTSK